MFAAGSQLNLMHRATELQADLAGEADGLTESNGGKPAKAGKPQDSLAAVLETAKRADRRRSARQQHCAGAAEPD